MYLDQTPLDINLGATYEPIEKLQWWYQQGSRTATMIEKHTTKVDNQDFSAPNPATNEYYLATSYVFDDVNGWVDSPQPPPSDHK
jgi:hypothetical protein